MTRRILEPSRLRHRASRLSLSRLCLAQRPRLPQFLDRNRHGVGGDLDDECGVGQIDAALHLTQREPHIEGRHARPGRAPDSQSAWLGAHVLGKLHRQRPGIDGNQTPSTSPARRRRRPVDPEVTAAGQIRRRPVNAVATQVADLAGWPPHIRRSTHADPTAPDRDRRAPRESRRPARRATRGPRGAAAAWPFRRCRRAGRTARQMAPRPPAGAIREAQTRCEGSRGGARIPALPDNPISAVIVVIRSQ